MTGRSCHAIELLPQYVDVAVERWQAFTGETAKLEADGRSFAAVAAERRPAAGRADMGRRAHQPDPAQRRQVEAMAAYGIPETDIARVVGIDPKTLRKHYREELDLGETKANAQVAGFLFNSAKNGNVTAQIFWLKTRARWRETPAELRHSGSIGTYDLTELSDARARADHPVEPVSIAAHRRASAQPAHREPSPAAAARSAAQRRRVRRSLAEWARYRGFEPAAHHQLIIEEIEAFLDSDDEVLLLFAPPGSAKSTYVSVCSRRYYLARFPSNSILAATHSVEFAQRWGRRVRNDIAAHAQIARHRACRRQPGVRPLGADAPAANTTGSAPASASPGSGPISASATTSSAAARTPGRETVREKRWDWYVDDFSARLKPGAKRILMNTRWHEEDVAGRVLEQIKQGIVRGPGDLDPGHCRGGRRCWAASPASISGTIRSGYDYGEFLRARQRESIPMMWSALYQQRPAPEEGDYFKAEWLRTCTTAPAPRHAARSMAPPTTR